MMRVKAIAKRINDIERIAVHYGFDNQANKTIEEMDELKYELDKMNDGMFPLSKIIGELADVMIMTAQVAMFIGPGLIDQEIEYKIDRQLRRMERENTNSCVDCNKHEPSDPNTVCHPCEWEPAEVFVPEVCEWCDSYKGTPATTGICQRSGQRVVYNFTCADWTKERA